MTHNKSCFLFFFALLVDCYVVPESTFLPTVIKTLASYSHDLPCLLFSLATPATPVLLNKAREPTEGRLRRDVNKLYNVCEVS